jgi:hypothetical protein
MSLLANKICESTGLALLSDNPFASNFAEKVRLDNQVVRSKRFSIAGSEKKSVNLAEDFMSDLIISGISFRPETSMNKILKAKLKYKDELGLFRSNDIITMQR